MTPIKLAILGGGPAGFYAASRLLSLVPRSAVHPNNLQVHAYDRLWAPHGLVRYGVAPDHPEVKNCTHKFDETAQDPRFRFFGNVEVVGSSAGGTGPKPQQRIPDAVPLPLPSLLSHYTHLLLSPGCGVPITHPVLPFSSYTTSALSLVHWYTCHPASQDLLPPPLASTSHVTLIGNGNVALDIARILLSPCSRLAPYDVPSSVLSVLRSSAVQHVSIVARRGPREAAFTMKELREMMNLEGTAMVPVAPELLRPPMEGEEPLTRQQTRMFKLLQEGSKNKITPGSDFKTWSLDFFRSPINIEAFSPSSATERKASKARLTLAHTALSTSPPRTVVLPTGETSTLDTDMVITSLGHTTDPRALNDGRWFNPLLGRVRCDDVGRVAEAHEASTSIGGATTDGEKDVTLKNVYACGWARGGAKGVLGSTMRDAYAVAETILLDASSPPSSSSAAKEILKSTSDIDTAIPSSIENALFAGDVTDYVAWKRVDEEEVRRGAMAGKERERMDWGEARAFLSGVA